MSKEFLKEVLLGIPRTIRFLPFYLWEMTRCNVRVAIDALRPRPHFKPGFVDIDLTGYNRSQCWAAVCLITMTPGTLSLDLSGKSNWLHIHVLYLDDPAAAEAELYLLLRKALGKPDRKVYP